MKTFCCGTVSPSRFSCQKQFSRPFQAFSSLLQNPPLLFLFYYLGKRKTALNLTCLACQSKLNQVRVGFLNASSPSGHPLEKRKYNFLRIFSILQEFKIENSFENQEKFKKLHLQKRTILSDPWLKRQMLASLIKQNQGKLALKSRHEIQIFMGLKIFDAKAKKQAAKRGGGDHPDLKCIERECNNLHTINIHKLTNKKEQQRQM